MSRWVVPLKYRTLYVTGDVLLRAEAEELERRHATRLAFFAFCEDDDSMHVISKRLLRQFWALHRDAERPLRKWYKTATEATWQSFADVRSTFAQADQVGKFTVFNIGGNKYRLIVGIHFNRAKVYVRHVLTHEEYDRDNWKEV